MNSFSNGPFGKPVKADSLISAVKGVLSNKDRKTIKLPETITEEDILSAAMELRENAQTWEDMKRIINDYLMEHARKHGEKLTAANATAFEREVLRAHNHKSVLKNLVESIESKQEQLNEYSPIRPYTPPNFSNRRTKKRRGVYDPSDSRKYTGIPPEPPAPPPPGSQNANRSMPTPGVGGAEGEMVGPAGGVDPIDPADKGFPYMGPRYGNPMNASRSMPTPAFGGAEGEMYGAEAEFDLSNPFNRRRRSTPMDAPPTSPSFLPGFPGSPVGPAGPNPMDPSVQPGMIPGGPMVQPNPGQPFNPGFPSFKDKEEEMTRPPVDPEMMKKLMMMMKSKMGGM